MFYELKPIDGKNKYVPDLEILRPAITRYFRDLRFGVTSIDQIIKRWPCDPNGLSDVRIDVVDYSVGDYRSFSEFWVESKDPAFLQKYRLTLWSAPWHERLHCYLLDRFPGSNFQYTVKNEKHALITVDFNFTDDSFVFRTKTVLHSKDSPKWCERMFLVFDHIKLKDKIPEDVASALKDIGIDPEEV